MIGPNRRSEGLPPLGDGPLAKRLGAHIHTLAGRIGERNVFCPRKLEEAADFLRACWEQQGFRPVVSSFETEGIRCHNLEVEVPGKTAEIVLAGAHYDSVVGSPGANDNGSGVASMLELSAALKNAVLPCTLRFVAFVNEEPPWFQTDLMGSRVYARAARKRGDDTKAMLSLETMGYYRSEVGSQKYPAILSLVFPPRGNFISVVGNPSSKKLVRRIGESLMAHSRFPVECVSAPASLTGIDWSDHASFWDSGYPAVMLTDTAPYRYPHYHTAEDTPDKVDIGHLAALTEGLQLVLADLAGEKSVSSN